MISNSFWSQTMFSCREFWLSALILCMKKNKKNNIEKQQEHTCSWCFIMLIKRLHTHSSRNTFHDSIKVVLLSLYLQSGSICIIKFKSFQWLVCFFRTEMANEILRVVIICHSSLMRCTGRFNKTVPNSPQ